MLTLTWGADQMLYFETPSHFYLQILSDLNYYLHEQASIESNLK